MCRGRESSSPVASLFLRSHGLPLHPALRARKFRSIPLNIKQKDPARTGSFCFVPREGIEPPTNRSSCEVGLYHHPLVRSWALPPTYVGVLPEGIVSTPSPIPHWGLARDCFRRRKFSPNSPSFLRLIAESVPEEFRRMLYH